MVILNTSFPPALSLVLHPWCACQLKTAHLVERSTLVHPRSWQEGCRNGSFWARQGIGWGYCYLDIDGMAMIKIHQALSLPKLSSCTILPSSTRRCAEVLRPPARSSRCAWYGCITCQPQISDGRPRLFKRTEACKSRINWRLPPANMSNKQRPPNVQHQHPQTKDPVEVEGVRQQSFNNQAESSPPNQSSTKIQDAIQNNGTTVLPMHGYITSDIGPHSTSTQRYSIPNFSCARLNRTATPLSVPRFEALTHHQAGSCTH